MMRKQKGIAGLAMALVLATGLVDARQDEAATTPPVAADDPSIQSSETMPLASRSLVLGIADSDQRAIAVGERGQILVSESRSDWRQIADVPTRSTLTAVTALASDVWAVGHDQVILHSADGGLTWARQHVAPFSDDNVDDPRNGAPFLGVLFVDSSKGFAVGAYGLMMRTSDGGEHWEQVPITAKSEASAEDEAPAKASDDSWTFNEADLAVEEESDPHLNGIARTGSGGLFIAAERGSAYRSRDGGDTWERIQLPYDGSMFGAIGYEGEHVLAYGLRGHIFETLDLGDHWTEVDSGTELTLQGGTAIAGDGAVLVGNNGELLWRDNGISPFQRKEMDSVGLLDAVLAIDGGKQLILGGENGLLAHTVP